MAATVVLTTGSATIAATHTTKASRLATVAHRDIGRTIGRGQVVNARQAAGIAKSNPRVGRELPRLSSKLGARPATTATTSKRNLAVTGGSIRSDALGPRIAAQPTAVVTTSFAGTTSDEACGCEPPDPWIAVGPSHLVQSTNGMIRISNRAGTPLVTMPSWALFAVPSNRFDSDPRILWDAVHSRWVGVLTTFSGDFLDNGLRLAISETADPTAGWTVYPIDYGFFLPDYPGLSTSSSRIVISSDDFTFNPAPNYEGPTLLMIDWSNVLAGTDLYIGGFSFTDTSIGHFRPAIMLSSAVTTPIVFEDGTSPGYFEFGGNAHSPTLLAGGDLDTDFGILPFTLPPAPVQPGAVAISSATDERPTDAVYRNGQLWFVATGDYFDTVDHWSMARYTQVLTAANGTGATAATDYPTAITGLHYFMPGVGINGDGSVFVTATKTDATSIFPTTVFGAILNGGGLQPYSDVEASTTAYVGTRWGDYVGIAADPSGAGAVWVQHELANSDGSWRTSVVRIVSDGTAPSLPGAVSQVQLTPATLSATVPVRTSWGAATDADSGVRGYLVERSDDGGGFVGAETPGTSITAALRTGHTVRYRISAVDGMGIVGAPVYGPTYTPTLYQSNTSKTVYSTGWGSSSSSSYSGGSTKYSSTAGKTATFTATSARSIAIVATKATSRGSFKVYIDGVLKKTVSTYATSTKFRQLVYQYSWTTAGTHKVKVVISGTAGHARVDLDAFVVLR